MALKEGEHTRTHSPETPALALGKISGKGRHHRWASPQSRGIVVFRRAKPEGLARVATALNDDQTRPIAALESEENVFLTGGAGTEIPFAHHTT